VNKAYPLLFAALFSTAATAAGGTTPKTDALEEAWKALYSLEDTEQTRTVTSLAGAPAAMTVYIAPEPKLKKVNDKLAGNTVVSNKSTSSTTK
jgi:hypothetical protein